jgi:hypothetical protein
MTPPSSHANAPLRFGHDTDIGRKPVNIGATMTLSLDLTAGGARGVTFRRLRSKFVDFHFTGIDYRFLLSGHKAARCSQV